MALPTTVWTDASDEQPGRKYEIALLTWIAIDGLDSTNGVDIDSMADDSTVWT